MATSAPVIDSNPCAVELPSSGDQRHDQILRVMYAAIAPEGSDWRAVVEEVEALGILNKGMEARNLLGWLINNGFVGRPPFDPLARTERFLRLPR
ncbi:hypothetical protein KVG88_29945 [Pseudomonas sp. SWRI74]|uniref:Uncharacterized protein n=1 Tax=Pseudomonas azerbaijanoccidentalis TaxID=2842347 RepID=A0ABS6QZD4_9PSED|nr:hypothetical protein [Pseudomonas azerbaijanoccidentalis]MBV4524297.1 hypothetical protein [Pseudomonas azerbaijanoccidentalis]